MYKFLIKLENVEYFVVEGNNFILKTKDKKLFINEIYQPNLISVGFYKYGFKQTVEVDKISIFNSQNIKIVTLDRKSLIEKFFENGGIRHTTSHYDYSTNESSYNYYLHDFHKDDVKLILEDTPNLFVDFLPDPQKLLFWQPWTKVSVFSLPTGTTLWETNLSEAGVIRKILGISGDNLWVSVNHIVEAEHSWLEKRTYKLVVLDIHTGAVKKVIDHDYRFADFEVVYLEEKGTILSLQGHHNIANRRETSTIYEYDANTTSVLRAFEVPALAEVPLSIREYKFFENKIYFTASDGTVIVPNCIGVMDYQTLELLWYKKLGHSATRIEVTDTKIYFMNQNTDLYIYEREDPNDHHTSPTKPEQDDTTI